MLNIIEFIHNILKSHGIDIPFRTYKVIPINMELGIIECDAEAETLYIIFLKGSIMNYLQKFSGDCTLNQLKFNYSNSLAFWTILTYMLDIGDRHSENIMISHNGIVFHIDYGVIFGKCNNILIPTIRLDKKLIDALGGLDEYPNFKKICIDIFLILRKYTMLFFNLLNIINNISIPFKDIQFNSDDIANLINTRFFIGQNDDEASKSFDLLLDKSYDTIRILLSDLVHHYSKNK